MRILCLNLQQSIDSSCAEMFLKFTPRVQFREPSFVFLDIESTAGLFGGEIQTLKKAVDLARDFAVKATGAIANSVAVSQVLANHRPFEVAPYGGDTIILSKLPLFVLRDLEGLEVWNQKRPIEHIINFFSLMGMEYVDDILHFQEASFRERWGDIGTILWRRLHGKEIQIISPLESNEPLQSYLYFDDPISHLPLLMNPLSEKIKNLFHRLEGLGRFLKILELVIYCEYSKKKYHLNVEPVSPTRDLRLCLDLLEHRLQEIDFLNPIRQIEIFIQDTVEKIYQLDFFEARDNTSERWKRLVSLAQQADIEMGFLQVEPSHWPEDSYVFKTELPKNIMSEDKVHHLDQAIQVKKTLSKELQKSPRPSLILKEPLRISLENLNSIKLLTRFPTERIQSSWWKSEKARDYYFATTQNGQVMWVYKDLLTDEFYIQGYFD